MRVSDTTTRETVLEGMQRSRRRMEDLQIKNSTQKKILSPSDDPAANVKIMSVRTEKTAHSQFENNGRLAQTRLNATDQNLEQLYEIFSRAKEIALNQASGASANIESRLGVAQEVGALYQQLVGVANAKAGQQYLFGGYKTLTAPFEGDGTYNGDAGEIPVEIQKNVFVNINVPGTQVFKAERLVPGSHGRIPLSAVDDTKVEPVDPANVKPVTDEAAPPIEQEYQKPSAEEISLFQELDALRVGLSTNDTITIRDTLDNFDEIIRHIITLRAKVGSRVSGIDVALGQSEKVDLANAELVTRFEDADYADIWSSLAKEEHILKSTLGATQKLIQPTLLDFLR